MKESVFIEDECSKLLYVEAEQGNAEASQKRLEAISKMPILPINDGTLNYLLIKDGPIPEKHQKLHFILPSQQ